MMGRRRGERQFSSLDFLKVHSWLVYITVIHLFSLLYNIPLCEYALVHLTILKRGIFASFPVLGCSKYSFICLLVNISKDVSEVHMKA